MWVNGETTHVGPDWCTTMLFKLFFRSVFDAPGAKVTLPPSERASFAQTGPRGPMGASIGTYEAVTMKRGGKQKGVSTLKVILHCYMKNMLLACYSFRAKQRQALIWKTIEKGNFTRPRKHKTAWLSPARNMWDSEHFLSCAHPPPMPGIRNRPPACTSRGMIFF